jgi:hypothetical protein
MRVETANELGFPAPALGADDLGQSLTLGAAPSRETG